MHFLKCYLIRDYPKITIPLGDFKMKYLRSVASLLSGVAGIGLHGVAHAAPINYSSEYLGPSVRVIDMNDEGQIIGVENNSVLYRWSFDSNGQLNKERLPFTQYDVYDINNRGEILTKNGLYDTSTKTFLSNFNGKTIYGGYINDVGEVVIGSGVKYYSTPTAAEVNVKSGKLIPAAFNNNGLAVDSEGEVWDVRSGQKLGSKPSALSYQDAPYDLNDKNQILYPNGKIYDLTGKLIATGLNGYDLDNAGNLVGSKNGNAVLWLAETNTTYVLNSYVNGGLRLNSASHINDKGWIVADAEGGGKYLLKPVPVPSSGILLLSSLLGFLGLQRARLKKLFKLFNRA